MLWAKIRSLLKNLTRRNSLERDMAEELRFHIRARAEDLMARQGVSRDEAFRRARVEFGSIEKYREEARQARGLRLFDEIRGDLRFATRQLRRNKGFTIAVVLMLAIGIGGNTAAFNQLSDAVLQTLPIPHPEELRQLLWSASNAGFRTGGNAYQRPDGTLASSFSYPAYQYLRDRATTISGLICFGGPQTVNVGIPGRAESATALLVSGNYFRGLGVQAALGRTIAPNDDRPGEAASVAMLSYGFWQRALGGDSSVLGKTIAVNGVPVTIVGVTPREFETINPDWHVATMTLAVLFLLLSAAFAAFLPSRRASRIDPVVALRYE